MPQFFIYCRKSSEAEDRQVLSIDSQIAELKRIAASRGLRILEVLSEARSAKEPGRPIFNSLMRRIAAGEADGVICWKLDRLARNPIDGGTVLWAMKQHGITIITPSQTYRHADDNALLVYLEFGTAQKYIDDLSKNVRRGLRTKAERGWYPSVAPLGYLNSKTGEKGTRTIFPDPDRFALIRRMWDLMLTGANTPSQIRRMANNEWGFRTRPMPKLGLRPLSHAGIYRIFTDPFYYGWFEYPRGSGQWWKGSHEPMISEDEFERVQVLLGRKGKPKPAKHRFAYTGLIRCGECAGLITAQENPQIICSACRFKFASPRKEHCPRCQISIAAMKSPKRLHYTYYHCGKRRNPHCRQRAVQAGKLDEQIAGFLARIAVPTSITRYVDDYLDELAARDRALDARVRESQTRAVDECNRRLENLVRLHTSPQNADGALLSESEYALQRSRLLRERDRVSRLLHDGETRDASCFIAATFKFAREAPDRFRKGDDATKREILQAVGSNLTLTDKALSIEAKKPFAILADGLSTLDSPKRPFEPGFLRVAPERNRAADAVSLSLRRGRYDVRTLKSLSRRIARRIYRWTEEYPTEAKQILPPSGTPNVDDRQAA